MTVRELIKELLDATNDLDAEVCIDGLEGEVLGAEAGIGNVVITVEDR